MSITDQQLECLCVLADGEWRDRREIQKNLNLKYIKSNISSRIISPLVKMRIIEQEERPLKEGSRKKKKVVRIRTAPRDINESDEYRVGLIFYGLMRDKCEELHQDMSQKLENVPKRQKDIIYQKWKLYQTGYLTFDSWYKYFRNDASTQAQEADASKKQTYLFMDEVEEVEDPEEM